MSHNNTISLYEQEFFAQTAMKDHAEFQKKFFYERYHNAESWLDYWLFFNRFMKKAEPKNKEWDNQLLQLSKNQSLVSALSQEEQQHHKSFTAELHEFRPLGGTVGPTLKQWRSSVFSKSANHIDANPHDDLSQEKKEASARTLI